MKAQVLDDLFAARDAVSTTIINLTPQGNPAAQKQMQSLMRCRDKLTGAINQVIATMFNDVAPGLDQAETKLQTQTDALAQLQSTFDQINAVAAAVDGIIQTVGSIVKIVAAVA
jgi:hypothetical protein